MIRRELVRKMFLFGIVGATGIVVDYGFTYLFKEILLFDKYVSNSIGFIMAGSSNFFLNRNFVFRSKEQNVTGEYFSFIGIATFGLVFNTVIIWMLTDKFFQFNFYLSKIVAIGVVFIWNFTMNHLFTFRRTSDQ